MSPFKIKTQALCVLYTTTQNKQSHFKRQEWVCSKEVLDQSRTETQQGKYEVLQLHVGHLRLVMEAPVLQRTWVVLLASSALESLGILAPPTLHM